MKWIKAIIIFVIVLLLSAFTDVLITNVVDTGLSSESTLIDEVVFPHDQVVDVFLTIDVDQLANLNENAMDEEVIMADLTYNGYEFQDIGIRAKGNSSLMSVANSDSDRYSFKIDFNYYISGQNFLGLTKLNFNNVFSDPSMMAEYIGYESLESIGAIAPDTTYIALYINDAYFGLYLAVEQVNDVFLDDRFDDSNGDLYKPEMGVGSDLVYISDNASDYPGLVSETNSNSDNSEIIELIKAIDNNEDLDDIFNVDSFLSYLAMSSLTIHLDSYQGGMFHNYYLYDNNGTFEWITWDLNMIFNGFPAGTDEIAINYLIDEPVGGAMENYPLVETILANEDYMSTYHDYLETLMTGYFEATTFSQRVNEIYEMIKPYVETDPTSFYSYEEFESALFAEEGTSLSLLTYMSQRMDNVARQLDGSIASTNDGQGNASTAKGGMNGGGPGDGAAKGQRPGANAQEGNAIDANAATLENAPVDGNTPPEMTDNMGGGPDLESLLPEGMTMADVPENIRTAIENGQVPDMEEVKAFLDEIGVEPPNVAGGEIQGVDGVQSAEAQAAAGIQGRPNMAPNGLAINTAETQMDTMSSTDMIINFTLLIVSIITMMIFSHILRKKAF